ncbi:MAG: M23 family metallopeptidase [Anaerolineales bacterium]|nr:M23 family metallopeptidase [Anaerolineales bacterium]
MTPRTHRHIVVAVRLLLAILIALLATNVSSPALAQSASKDHQQDYQPPVQADDPETALQLALDAYMKQNPSSKGSKFALGDVYVENDWAYAIARRQNTKSKKSLVEYVVLLASRTPEGWQALAPQVNDPVEYNALLHSFPFTLIDESSQAMFTLPEPIFRAAAVTANFNEHLLPFPAGKNGYVPKKDGSGHENQVDFNISPGDTVYVTKPGKVVFVKESSNSGCNDISCWQQANMVVVEHSSTEYSWYVHLAYNSVPVILNSYVALGTKIGIEGQTGYASGVHLHYMVSTGHSAWTDPANPNAAPWGSGMTPVDFTETTWSNLTVGNTYTSQNTSDPSAVAWGWNREDLFVQGENNILYHKVFNGGWDNTWEPLDGILTSSPDAASWGTGHLDVYVRGIDNNLWYRRYLNGGWGGWLSAGAPPGGAMSSPSAVSTAANRIDLFVRGTDNGLWHRRYNNGSWGAWEPLGGVLTSGPDAASPGNGQIHVFLAGVNKVMWRCVYSNGACTWSEVPGGASSYDQSGVSPSTNRVDVFARGAEGQLFHRIWNGSAWGAWEPLEDGYLTSGPDAASWRVNNHLDVFVRGRDNNVYHRWQYGGGWSNWEGLGKP